MPVPYSAGSDTTVGMVDLEMGKKAPSITVTPVDGPLERPVLGRRKTTASITGDTEQKLGYEGEEDALTKIVSLHSTQS